MRKLSTTCVVALVLGMGNAARAEEVAGETPEMAEEATTPDAMADDAAMSTSSEGAYADDTMGVEGEYAFEDPDASSQTGLDRDGLFFGLGFGLGMSSLAEESFAGAGAASFNIHLGQAITNDILVGIELLAVGQFNDYAENEAIGSLFSSVLATGTYFPLAAIPFSVTGGLGWGSAIALDRLGDDQGDPTIFAPNGNGVSWVVAAGYDFIAGDGFNMGVQARYDGAAVGSTLDTISMGSLALWFNWY